MALSFEESRRLAAAKAAKAASAATVQDGVATIAESGNVAPVETLSETFSRSSNYVWYNDFLDEQFSTVSATKEVTVDSNQINITQENNSQVIPFEMPRYYDGVDLMKMTIQIHYVNANKAENYTAPVNVSYSDTKIRFYWLVSDYATVKDGTLQFEIMATGAITVPNTGETINYLWRTKPNDQLVVLKSLTGTGMTDPTGDDWYTSFLATMSQKVGEAQVYAENAKQSAEAAKAVVDGLDEKLSSYYTKDEVDGFVSLLEADIAGVDGLANFDVTYDASTQTITFYNGDAPINKVVLNTDPSAEWVSAYNKTVESKIESAVSPVRSELSDYKETNDAAVKALQDSVGDLPNTLQSDYYNKSTIDALLEDKAEKTALDGFTNELSVIKGNVSGLQSSVDTVNSDIAELQSKIDNFEPDENSGREYDITYEDSKLSLLENGSVKTQVVIQGGSGGGSGGTSVITIERLNGSSLTVVSGDAAIIEFNFKSVDNSGDDTGDATATWYLGTTKIATQTIKQGKNTFDITEYLRNGENKIKLSVTDSVESVATKTWSINVVEFYLESSFDDSLVYNGEVTFRFTPYGNISKTIKFSLDGKSIGETTTSVTGRQMTYTIPTQKHGSHLLEVSMEATVNEKPVSSNIIKKDLMWADESETAPIISCAILDYTAKQYSNVAINYTVYNPVSSTAKVVLAIDGIEYSTLSVGRTVQTWTYKTANIGSHTLTITCGDTIKTINVVIEDLGITIEPVITNLAFDFNPAGKTNADEDRLWTNGSNSMTVSDNFDWSNGGYQIDSNGDTYFCVKSGTTATIDYKLFGDDAKKLGKNFKIIFETTNVKNYDATAITCLNSGIGLNIQAQNITMTSEQNSISLPTCEDDFMEFELNILPDSQSNQMLLWLDGIPCRDELYASNDNFTQTRPVPITIGSPDCDVHIYRMKAYMMNLTNDEILDNFIADAKNAEEMVNRYNRNNILNASGELDPDTLAERCPDLRIIKISAPTFTSGKSNEVSGTTVQQIYKNGRATEDNWTATGSHKGQGTSSNAYGESARNVDIKLSGGFTFGDGSTGDKYAMTENSVAENYFNIKVNVASSENANNPVFADDYNEFNPYQRTAKKNNPKVRDTMEFHPCVIFIQETDTDNATTFKDGQWHFYACGDFGNSKKNADAMGMDPENHKEFIVELCNNTNPQVRFLDDDLSEENWDGKGSFEMRYSNPNCTSEELKAGKDAVQTLLTWVVNADDEEFVNHFEDHFIKDSALFFYLFTERHTMVDNRAKNVFMHTEDLVHWDFCFDYDNDTAQGNDNEGGLTLTYGYEDTDTIGTKSVFNASDSKLWCKVRDLFQEDLEKMFLDRESKLAWSSTRILKKMEDYQDVKPERLWIMDMQRKYMRTYEDNGTTSYLPMMHGNKRHQRRQYQRYQEKYIASKYTGATATSDDMTIRGYTPTEWSGVAPDGSFHIVPYADTYVSVRYGSAPVKMRGKRGQTYTVECPIDEMNDTEVYVYNASIIQSIGDISGFYPGYVDFSHGIKLTDLQVGNETEGYTNTNLTDFAVGNNTLLEHLDLQNVPNLKKSVDLSGCTNLETFRADGSGITGVSFAKGGKIKTAHVPAIASLSMTNLNYLTDLQIEDYANLVTITIEDCPSVDAKAIIESSENLSRVRLTGVDWSLNDTSLLDRLYKMTGLDETGHNSDHSVVEGKVHVPVIREKQLAEYAEQWPDLEVSYNTLVQQFVWTFVNKNGEVLDIQYVDKGSKAVDPITRENNPIPTPTTPSSVSTDFTFDKWDTEFTTVFENQTVTALYTESIRNYTIKYLVNSEVWFQKVAPYGSLVLYEGDTPKYTAEESAFKYYLFDRWDKSGYVTGDKDIHAVFDTCEYTAGYFNGKDIGDLRPVEIYAMIQTKVEKDFVTEKDAVTIQMGSDFSYEDIDETVLISEETEFTGSNYVDTGVKLFDEDRDFVLAIDYKMTAGNANNSVLAQCFETNGSNGFKLWTSSGSKLTWGTSSTSAVTDCRDMVVMRHIKGENGLHVYSSNVRGTKSSYVEIARTRSTKTDATIVFGCAKMGDDEYENFATGSIYWAKVWFADLGEKACEELVSWTHENIVYEMSGFKSYYLTDSSKRCSMTFLQQGVLDGERRLNSVTTSKDGWNATELKDYLDARLVSALPIGWRQLVKQVTVLSSAGAKSVNPNKDMIESQCYFFIPSAIEVNNASTFVSEPYVNEVITNETISYFTDQASRIKYTPDGVAVNYWLRSPNYDLANYFWMVQANGSMSGYNYPNDSNVYVATMFCI